MIIVVLFQKIALKKKGMAKDSFRTTKMATKPLGVYFHKNFAALTLKLKAF